MSMIVTDSIAIVVVNEIPPKLPIKIEYCCGVKFL